MVGRLVLALEDGLEEEPAKRFPEARTYGSIGTCPRVCLHVSKPGRWVKSRIWTRIEMLVLALVRHMRKDLWRQGRVRNDVANASVAHRQAKQLCA